MSEVATQSHPTWTSTARATGGSPRRVLFWEIVLAAAVPVMVLAEARPDCKALLELDRSAVAAGQWWRVLTGNLVHFGWIHLAADLGAMAALYWIARRQDRRAIWVVLLGAIGVGISVQLWGGDIRIYRGLSGIDYALFAFVAVVIAIERRGWAAAGIVAVLKILTFKSIYEMATGTPLVPTSLPPGVSIVGVAHLAGLLTGGVMGLVFATGFRRCRRADAGGTVALAEVKAASSGASTGSRDSYIVP